MSYITARHLTAYQLACGYVEVKDQGAIRIKLWQEHGAYHVRAHDWEKHERVFWETFRTLTEARNRFNRGAAS